MIDRTAAGNRFKVLHIITGLNVGGAETMLARLLEQRSRAPDICVEVISLIAPGHVGQRIARAGIRVHTPSMRAGRPSLGAVVRLVRLVATIRPDVIMGWMHHGQIAASFAAWVCCPRAAVIWNVRHSLDGYRQEKPMSRAVLRLGAWLSRTPAAIIYNSQAASQQYRALGYRPRCQAIMPNGFEFARPDRPLARQHLRDRFALADSALTIGMIARNHPMKDVATLAAAFADVVSHRADAHLLIAGESMDRPDPRAAAALAMLPPGSFTLAGHCTDVAAWIAGLDIVALSSAWGEGFPNILGEAMAAGVPCVTTDVGDAGFVVGETGRVVPARDPHRLAEALLEVAALGPEGRAALGRAARRRIGDHFTLDHIAGRYAALLRDHAPRGRGSHSVPAGSEPPQRLAAAPELSR